MLQFGVGGIVLRVINASVIYFKKRGAILPKYKTIFTETAALKGESRNSNKLSSGTATPGPPFLAEATASGRHDNRLQDIHGSLVFFSPSHSSRS